MGSDGELGIAGFQDGELYESARPDYPEEALRYFVTVFGLGERSRALDLGAGTGIFTRQMRPYVGVMTAVEPSSSMRESLRAACPDVTVLEGRDVDIPLADQSMDVVFAAQAFHWFEEAVALREIRRVLGPSGGLGLIWNERDETSDWVRELSHAMEWDTRQPYEVGRDFTGVVAAGPFTNVERVTFTHTQRLSRDALYRRVLSTSYISTMSASEREALMVRVRTVVEGLREPISLPYVTTAYSAIARP